MKTVSIAVILILVTAGFVFNKTSTTELIICADGSGEIYTPTPVCRWYLSTFRTTPTDVDAVRRASGIDFILNGTSLNRFNIAELYIEAGLDINESPSLTPLCNAIALKQTDNVKFLLAHKATINHSKCDAIALSKSIANREMEELLEGGVK
jgi:hypothetical protein